MQMPQTAPPAATKLQKRDAAVDDGTMRWYLSSIGTRRLLDREEEIRLAMAIKELLGWQPSIAPQHCVKKGFEA